MEIGFTEPKVEVEPRVKYKLLATAVIEGYSERVEFTFERIGYSIILQMEDLHQAIEIHDFFKRIFDGFLLGRKKMRKSAGFRYVEWPIRLEKFEEMLDVIGEIMGFEWKEAFKKR